MSDAQRSWSDNFEQRRPMRAASAGPARPPGRARVLPNVPRRLVIIAIGLTGSVLLAATIIWGISRMGPRSVPLIEADGRPFRVRPDTMPPPLATPALPERGARPEQARLAPAPEAPRTEALRREMAPPPAPTPAEPAAPPAVARAAPPAASPRSATPAAATPAAATPAVAPPRVATPAAGRALVQLSAAVSEDAAKAEWERLRRRVPELAAHQPRITRFEREGQAALWRLRVGGLADPAAARALCEQVRARGGACNPV